MRCKEIKQKKFPVNWSKKKGNNSEGTKQKGFMINICYFIRRKRKMSWEHLLIIAKNRANEETVYDRGKLPETLKYTKMVI